MTKNIYKGMKLSMGAKNGIISTALLSLLFEKNRKDNLDLIRPFVECAICEKYSIGDKINFETVGMYLEAEFGFENVVDSVVESILERLSKDKFVSIDHHNFYYQNKLDEKYDKFIAKKERAKRLLDQITVNLRSVFASDGLQSLTDEEIHNILYSYFEEYGLNIFNKKASIIHSKNNNPYLFSLANYIIREEKKNSTEFLDIVQLYKGVLLSSVIYIQPENSDLYYARFKNTTVYLDAPIVLRILGLCSDVDNRRGKQLYDLLKGKVAFKIFEHSFNELCGILLAYRKSKNDLCRCPNTLEYFDKSKASITDITNYYIALPQTLSKLGIAIEDGSKYVIDATQNEYLDLQSKLKNVISFYETHDSALKYDTDSLFLIDLIRGKRVVTAIENCGAIFVSMNKPLTIVAFEWKNNEMNSVPLAISDTDISVIMWLKEYKSRKDFPKDFIVANAFGTLETISDSFVNQLIEKADRMEKTGILSSVDVSLVLENIFIQKKLIEASKGNIDKVTEADIIEVRDKYKAEYAKELGLDNEKLAAEKEKAELKIEEMEQERDKNYTAMLSIINKQAHDYAKLSTLWISICKWTAIIICLCIFATITIIEYIWTGFESGWLIAASAISGLFGFYGMIDTIVPAFRLIEKQKQKLVSRKYTLKFSELLREYEEEAKK